MFLLLLASIGCKQAQDIPLFRIAVQNKTGYIDSTGKVVIQPQFHNGSEFSEGLAAVRQDGLFGFINSKAEWVIQPVFDYAMPFMNGIAEVYKNGKVQFINTNNQIVLPAWIRSIHFLSSSKIITETTSGRYGLYDQSAQKLVIDTIYANPKSVDANTLLLRNYSADTEDTTNYQVVFDTSGNVIVNPYTYEYIDHFNQGIAAVIIKYPDDTSSYISGAIDVKGSLLFSKSYSINGQFQEGFNSVNIRYSNNYQQQSYTAIVNLKGELVLNDSSLRIVEKFSNGRAFVGQDFRQLRMINTQMEYVGNDVYEDVVNNTFTNGYAIVKKDREYGIIDTNGVFVVPDTLPVINAEGILNEGYYLYSQDKYTDTPVLALAKIGVGSLTAAVIEQADSDGYKNGLLEVQIGNRQAFLDKAGKIVWQAPPTDSIGYLNIDYMKRGYFYAYSTPSKDSDYRTGGWGRSENIPVRIKDSSLPKGNLLLVADTSKHVAIHNSYKALNLYVCNNTSDTLQFNAQDSRLYLKLQALNQSGEWVDIEYLPSSWCGNSYHVLKLEPGYQWNFVFPDYRGSIKTRIRARLAYIHKNDRHNEKLIYSNEFSGSVNPAQFWNKERYTARNIMDPYFE